MKKTILPLLFLTVSALALELPKGMNFGDDGALSIGAAKLSVQLANPDWHWLEPKDQSGRKLERDAGSLRFSAALLFDGTKGTLRETLRRNGENRWRFEAEVEFEAPVSTKTACVNLSLPLLFGTLTVDGNEIAVPETEGQLILRHTGPAQTVAVELWGGIRAVVSGDLSVFVQDNRRWNPSVSVRIFLAPAEGALQRAKVAFDLDFLGAAPQPVSLAKAANRTFTDTDGSGWTGQGAGNDLRGLKPGRHEIAGFPFEVLPGKGAIVVGRSAEPQITLELGGAPAAALNLLHASAWPPAAGETLGFLDLVYGDGKTESIPVQSGRDCGNWWLGSSYLNAAIAVRLENGTAAVGLYASSFPLAGNRPVSVTFRAANSESFWMIAAVTLSGRPVRFPLKPDHPVTVRESKNWQPLHFERKIVAGSPLDFSGHLDAPAGKYGFLRSAPEGGFTFENAPEKRLRLYGVNLCMAANFPDRKTTEELVEYLARMGYNTVRFHHHDNYLADSNNLDRLDYLFAKLKERGFYLTTDLYTSRVLKDGDKIEGIKDFNASQVMKALLPINRSAVENWKAFARNWMNHRNPYTGLTWGEDPALVCLNLVNEEVLADVWNRTPESAALYRAKFAEWRQANGAPESDFPRFLQELQEKVLDEQMAFVKNELKLKTMITSLNYGYHASLTPLRDKFDLVDNHQYFSHPFFPQEMWRLPMRFDQGSAIRRGAFLPRQMMPTRIFGKAFAVTEFNFCNPNIFRAEGAPLLGAYAALQDWAGVWRFAWSHDAASLSQMRVGGPFDAANDPMQQFGDRIIHALFTRGDFQPAKEKISMAVPRDRVDSNGFPEEFALLGLAAQIGSHVEGKALPPGVKLYRPGMTAPADSRLKLDREAGSFAVTTPFSEAITLRKGDLAADRLRVRGADAFMTVAAIALDRKPLGESKSVLVIHLTNITTTDIRFGSEDKTLLLDWGRPSHLVERGSVTVELAADASWRVVALASDGSLRVEVKSEFAGGVFRFKADTCALPGGVIAYHLSR